MCSCFSACCSRFLRLLLLQGGKFVLTVKGEDLGQLDQWWLHAVLAAIGETLEVSFVCFAAVGKLERRRRMLFQSTADFSQNLSVLAARACRGRLGETRPPRT